MRVVVIVDQTNTRRIIDGKPDSDEYGLELDVYGNPSVKTGAESLAYRLL